MAVVCVTVMFGATSCDSRDYGSKSERIMPDFLKNTRPFCLGRFVIDIPVDAKVRAINQSIEGFGEIRVHTNLSKATLFAMADRKETELRAKPHRKEGTLLSGVDSLADSKIISFRDDEINTLDFSILGYFWKENTGYVFSYGADDDKLEEAKSELRHSIGLISARGNDTLPNRAGFCVDNAIVTESGFRLESVSVAFTVPSVPGLEFGAGVSTVLEPGSEDLITRSDQNLPAVLDLHPDVQLDTLRKGNRQVAGLGGQEIMEVAGRGTSNELLLANWEYLGEGKSSTRPSIEFDVSYDAQKAVAQTPISKLTEDELTAFWDSLLESLSLRKE